MSSIYTEHDTNIDTYPTSKAIQDLVEITCGDLHASFPKLLHILVLYGIIDLPKENYLRLINLYYEENSFDINEDEWLTLLNSITLLNEDALIRLIGDETGDRGMNDLYILLLLHKIFLLRKASGKKPNIKIIFSNHGAEFVIATELCEQTEPETSEEDEEEEEEDEEEDEDEDEDESEEEDSSEKLEESQKNENVMKHLTRPNLNHPQYTDKVKSLINLDKYINGDEEKWSRVHNIIKEVYQPALTLLDYTLNEEEQSFTIYSHAPIDLTCIPFLAKLFSVKSDLTTPLTTAKTIDLINAEFKKHVTNQTVHELYGAPLIKKYPESCNDIYLTKTAYDNLNALLPSIDTLTKEDDSVRLTLLAIVWNRASTLDRNKDVFPGWVTSYVHGHTPRTCEPPHCNLDDACGKIPQPNKYMKYRGSSTLKMLVTTPSAPQLYSSITSQDLPSAQGLPAHNLGMFRRTDSDADNKGNSERARPFKPL